MIFVVFDLATGAVKRVGRCQASDFARQALEGEGVLESANTIDPNKWRVESRQAGPELVPVE